MTPSDKQIKIFEEYENTNNNLAIEAAPGSGKTTTLLELLKRTPPHLKSVFLAFNKSIANELQSKVPSGTDVFTLHSLGYRTLLKNTNQRYKLNELKNWIIGKQILDLHNIKDEKKRNIYLFIISKLVDLYRLNLCETSSNLQTMADKYNISTINGEIKDAMQIVEYLRKYNRQKHDREMMIDYVDMLYLPFILLDKSDFPKYNVVMIDESQDLNSLQWKLVQQLFKLRTRFVAVGDKYQAIYSFQGADSDVFENIKHYPSTTVLPLSYSYRCPTKVVEEANKIFNFIESTEGKEEGEIIYNGTINTALAGDFILCRNNQPLIEVFLKLMKQGKKCQILGKEYGKGLLNILNKIEDFSKPSIDSLLDDKIKTLKEKGVKTPQKNQSYQDLVEKISILTQLHSEFNLQKMRDMIENMFSDNAQNDAIVLSTIHKSKGLESNNVFFLFKNLIPSKFAETELELNQEQCLKYVCITRAKKKLIYVDKL